MSSCPIISVIGKPNVGKSTLFNRIINKKSSIVDYKKGTTIDLKREYFKLKDIFIEIIDTGGFILNNNNIIEKKMMEQNINIINKSDLILFIVNFKINEIDIYINDLLRKVNAKKILVVNKFHENKFYLDNYLLGFDKYYNYDQKNELLREIYNFFKINKKKYTLNEINEAPIISVIGKPNVGKSTFVNSLFNEYKSITNEKPRTTKDFLRYVYLLDNIKINIIDTAGISIKNNNYVDCYSMNKSIKVIKNSHICLLMLDIKDILTKEDKKIINIIRKLNKIFVILINKIDLVQFNYLLSIEYKKLIRERLKEKNINIFFISSKKMNSIKLKKIITKCKLILDKNNFYIKTYKLNKFMKKIKFRNIKFKFCTQIKNSKIFIFYIKNKLNEIENKNLKKYLIKIIKNEYGISEIPIKIKIKWTK